MKRIIIVLSILASSLSIFASPGLGYGLAPVGQKDPTGGSFGGASISLFLSPSVDLHVAELESEVVLSPWFESASFKLSTSLFTTTHHPFSWMFPNTMMWAPRIGGGMQYRDDEGWNAIISFSPLCLYDTQFMYEFLSPYALYSIDKDKWGYGVYIFRFSYFMRLGK